MKCIAVVVRLFVCAAMLAGAGASAQDRPPVVTHGPVLGQISADGVAIWIRTSRPADFEVRYGPGVRIDGFDGEPSSVSGRTRLGDDNTGWIHLTGLEPGTRYAYQVRVDGSDQSHPLGTFRTLPHPDHFRNDVHNPEGWFNFSFEYGACNFQFRGESGSFDMPAYATMNERIADEVDFHIMNGDFIYETRRRMPVDVWMDETGVDDLPPIVRVMPDVVGVWANYKLYFDRSPPLREWYRRVPSFFMFDDHELLNDINATGDAGTRNRRTLFRDIGVSAWRDYLGWANPLPAGRRDSVIYGYADVAAGSDILHDPSADFSALNVEDAPTLHVHWNNDHPSAGVYDVVEVLDDHRIRVSPTPPSGGDRLAYTVGMRNYFDFRVSNAHFFVLDVRSHRSLHDFDVPDRPDVSMLGDVQLKWLLDRMQTSDARFFFVVSPVSFTFPHVAPNIPDKDESWTAYLHERERLFEAFGELGRPVLLLTGDLHNSAAIQVGGGIWEFLAGHQNSPSHYAIEEGNRPASGPFSYHGRTVDIQWSSYLLEDVSAVYRRQPHYTVVQVNNVFNNPDAEGNDRWVAYPEPQVVVQFYDGRTGKLLFAQSVSDNLTP